MIENSFEWMNVLGILFIISQLLYLSAFLVEAYFAAQPINLVRLPDDPNVEPPSYPYIVLFYPVLDELEETMRTTFQAVARLNYPRERFDVIAIPNDSDHATLAALKRLQSEFGFLSLMPVPATSDPSWNVVWKAWDKNSKVYWWHEGPRAGLRDLPPKKTRQLIYAFYTVAQQRTDEDFLVNYLDADSAPRPNHFRDAAFGIQQYDVIQSTNIAGNLMDSLAASFHAFDHCAWDGKKYPRLTADGRHPYYVLGKGQFFKASDLYELGGFHPWLTIEDPEVGLRFWKNGKRLGVNPDPLIEEVPTTFREGIKQRKRWIAGFWQTLSKPLDSMGFTPAEKLKARLNFVPCMSLLLNAIGIPLGIWALYELIWGTYELPRWTYVLAAINLLCLTLVLGSLYISAWKNTALVLPKKRHRLLFLMRVNPVSIWIWWTIWAIPLWLGWRMYRKDMGLVWERTEKINANESLIVAGLNRFEVQTGREAQARASL